MARKKLAAWLLLTGVLIGLLGNILFYDKAIGLSFPLFVVVFLGILFAFGFLTGANLSFRNVWVALPLVFFAVMMAVRGDTQIMMLNFLAVLTLGGLLLHYLPAADRHLDDDSLLNHTAGLFETGLYLFPGAAPELSDSWGWFRDNHLKNRGVLFAVGRGILIALPILLIFAFLLASADLVFGQFLEGLLEGVSFQYIDEWLGRGLLTFLLAWLTVGALAYALARRLSIGVHNGKIELQPEALNLGDAEQTDTGEVEPEPIEAEEAEDPTKRVARPLKLGLIEGGIVLGSVDLLFAAFVLIQLAYLFGGQANISVEGFTYSQYARRGFFELVAVSVLTLGLVLLLDWVTVREGKTENRVFRALSVIIIVLTVIMLVSASRRMWLYEEVYGFTHLRVYTHVFMVWLGILLGVFLLSLFRLRRNIFSLGVILVTIGYLGTLNLMNIDLYIADRNIERYEQGQKLDTDFLITLSVDATPAMVALYQEKSSNSAIQEEIGQWLAWQLDDLDQLRAGMGATVFSANLSRETAWGLLDGLRDSLPRYDPRYRPSRGYGF